ncbi:MULTISPECIES: hypothetical protein [Staphylococcus]|nr:MULTISPECIES: hypothetical protein [Staphylococcus]
MQFIVKNDMQYIQQYNYVYLGSTLIEPLSMLAKQYFCMYD